MSEVTVAQLANVVGIPADQLMEQLESAGIQAKSPEDRISDEEKARLLLYLRESHGKKKTTGVTAPSKVTLRRKTVSELRQSTTSGRSTMSRVSTVPAKTVSVEIRKKRTYVKRTSVESDESKTKEAEEARKALEEQAKEKAEIEARKTAEVAKRAKEEAAKQAEEEVVKRLADEEVARKVQEEALFKAKQETPTPEKEKAAHKTDSGRSKKGRKDSKREGKEIEGEQRLERKELHVAEGARGRRKKKPAKKRKSSATASDAQHAFQRPSTPVVHEVKIPESITGAELAQRMTIKAPEVTKVLIKMGITLTINQPLDRDTAVLVVEEMGHVPVQQREEDIEADLLSIEDEAHPMGDMVTRPPVVTIMGHVDHGKTSLLDYIRSSRIAAGEAGGITQHIGAYHVDTDKGTVSFLDTPGHAAFTAMRARGAKVTDIVILVVAADDGVMPQTKEAIQHAKAAGVPLIVAINKIDKEDANPDRVIQELSQEEVMPEDWGGDTMFARVSAKTGAGIDELLDAILLQAEVLELKAVKEGVANGSIVESSLDKGRGPVATVLVQSGTLNRGDMIVSGKEYGRVRAMFDENGRSIKTAGPSIPVVVLGLSGTPEAGDDVRAVSDERRARELAELRHDKQRDTRLAAQKAAKLDEMFTQMAEGETQNFNIIVKADVQGSVEALKDSLINTSSEEVRVRVVASGVGGINESDANLAVTSNAIIIGFNVRADAGARRVVEERGIDMRYYSIIYEIIDDVKKAIFGMLSPGIREEIIGHAEVRDVFRNSKIGTIAGCMVTEGVVKRNSPIRVLRDNVVIYEGALESLRRFKDDVNEVKNGMECGIGVKNYNDVQVGDQIEVFERTEVARTV
ncbi:MAG: translation initiation factor IF-2 [Candidatus Thiodiazotropha sp. (ex Lucinoma aequizonata)]|nr:translation initiation factor IF-2 [Candidatus Thiodiazotropha sp. (ex Lucinoma aequizonata)]MCU7887790.1 translation initiation factor IF-2 [Candidatus Thiodiazotropha sp. (ex Lucinoma aequizonata)]MCU7893945.1 translation initiation factor IF-2 [Candidatus Thiodiazotropha sp. (ex Lucinoma aequizonata)]MCU7899321.1 translation initiation factor IF-2 [Candidatus Thiodiazotropha sp. (ex Lucinoma aequizonata)]MCU7903855.1 translation initiation factor IF-2 [Candidatus Thiodiazotropha sp. (ex L